MVLQNSNQQTFVDFILEKGKIPFVVRGSVSCLENFNFQPLLNVKIFGLTYHIRVFGENQEATDKQLRVNVNELVDDVVFHGEMELLEHNIDGISKALYALELWADFLCIAVGNPKVFVEVQNPINVVMATQSNFDDSSLQR